MTNNEVEPCPVCSEGWRLIGSAFCHECYEGKIDTLIQALALQEVAENAHMKCDECDPEDAPETCEKCFPLYDDARVARRRVLASYRKRSLGVVPAPKATDADARLMAAAPALLKALRELLEIEDARIATGAFVPNEEAQRRIDVSRALMGTVTSRECR